jgi:hypothetical protein
VKSKWVSFTYATWRGGAGGRYTSLRGVVPEARTITREEERARRGFYFFGRVLLGLHALSWGDVGWGLHVRD